MGEDLPRYGDTITPRESADLMRLYAKPQQLYGEVADAVKTMAEELKRVHDLQARILEIADRVNQILSGK
jgi:hypothetical protein